MTESPFVLVPGLACTERVFESQLGSFWSRAPVMLERPTGHDSVIGMAHSLLSNAPPSFNLVCFSMGGYVGLEVARLCPQRVDRIILISTSATSDQPSQLEHRRKGIERAKNGQYEEVASELFQRAVSSSRLDDNSLRDRIVGMALDVGPAAYVRQQTAIARRADLTYALPQIVCPALVVVGEEDSITPPAAVTQMASLLKNATLKTLKHCGHFSLYEEPNQLNDLIESWLDYGTS